VNKNQSGKGQVWENTKEENMKKLSALIAGVALFAFCATASAVTLEDLDKRVGDLESKTVLSANIRWFYSDDALNRISLFPNVAGRNEYNHLSLHALEISAKKEYKKVGAELVYRFNQGADFLVNGFVYYKNGGHLVRAGQFFVPFGLYNWGDLSLYNPFLSVPGSLGYAWDFDWGLGYTYTDSNPSHLKIELAYMLNDAATGQTDGALNGKCDEKDTFSGRVSVDAVAKPEVNWNIALSYMNGKLQNGMLLDADPATVGDADKSVWAVDTAVVWGKKNKAAIRGEYADYKEAINMKNAVSDGKFGLIELQYDINKVKEPFNKVSLMAAYSYDDPEGANNMTTDLQEQIVVTLCKNLSMFLQFDQVETDTGAATSNKIHRSTLWFKYNLF